jgi:hypothetical protein
VKGYFNPQISGTAHSPSVILITGVGGRLALPPLSPVCQRRVSCRKPMILLGILL